MEEMDVDMAMEELQGQKRLTSHKSRVVQVLREIAAEDAALLATHTSTSNWQQAHTVNHGYNGTIPYQAIPSNICCQHRLVSYEYIRPKGPATNTGKPVL